MLLQGILLLMYSGLLEITGSNFPFIRKKAALSPFVYIYCILKGKVLEGLLFAFHEVGQSLGDFSRNDIFKLGSHW